MGSFLLMVKVAQLFGVKETDLIRMSSKEVAEFLSLHQKTIVFALQSDKQDVVSTAKEAFDRYFAQKFQDKVKFVCVDDNIKGESSFEIWYDNRVSTRRSGILDEEKIAEVLCDVDAEPKKPVRTESKPATKKVDENMMTSVEHETNMSRCEGVRVRFFKLEFVHLITYFFLI